MSFRRGACPALSAPMQTGDGLLVRLATAGASLAPPQLIALCAAAESHGNGLVEITARGNFQIRGLTPDSAVDLALAVTAMELGLRDGVPVETNPLSGLDPAETANAAPLAAIIREAIDATDLASRLSPKVSVVIDGGGTVDMSALSADVRLMAVRQDDSSAAWRNSAVEWLISTGGDALTATPLLIAPDEASAKAVTLTLLDAFAARGPAARARDLAPTELKALLSPFTGRGCRQAGEGQHRGRQTQAQPLIRPFGAPSPRERGEGIPLTDGRVALPVALPFGSILAGELAAFLDAAIAHGVTELCLAPGRGMILICPSEAAASIVLKAARAAGLLIDDGDPRTRIFACPGSAGCASGHFAAREIAVAVAREMNVNLDADFTLHISGCAKGCAHPTAASLTLVGTEHGAVLVENGTARQAGIPFGKQDIAARLAGAVRERLDSDHQSEIRRKPHPAHSFAGD